MADDGILIERRRQPVLANLDGAHLSTVGMTRWELWVNSEYVGIPELDDDGMLVVEAFERPGCIASGQDWTELGLAALEAITQWER